MPEPKILSLHLSGFKSFLSHDIPLGALTLLTGINSSGKSSVIQALRMLHQASRSGDPLLRGHGSADELKNRNSQWPVVISATLADGTIPSVELEASRSEIQADDFPDLTYISASRFGPQSLIPIYNNDEIGFQGENMLRAIELHNDDIVPAVIKHPGSEGDTLFFNLRGWLSAITPGTKFDNHIVRQTDSSYMTFNNFRAANVGFGLSYTMPVIAALLLASVKGNNQVVMIENPEAHLHPRGQTNIADLVCRAVEAGVQVVVETHSDHFFDGVRIYARNHPGFEKSVVIHWCETDREGTTHIESPELRPGGKLSRWPEGLFDQFELNADLLL